MKPFWFFLLLFLLVVQINGQNIHQKFSDGICECIDDQQKNYPDQEPDDYVNTCFEMVANTYSEDLRNQFGDEFFDDENNQKRYEFGIEVGKILAGDCESFLSIYTDQYSQNNKRLNDNFSRAESLYAQGSYDEAIEYYSTVIRLANDNPKYFNSRGVAYFAKEDYYRAIADFIRSHELNPDDPMVLYNLGYSKYRLNDYQNAFEDISASLRINPGNCESHNVLGLIYNQAQNPDSALKSFIRAYECDSTIYSYPYNIGYIYYNQKDYKNALPYFLLSYNLKNPDAGLFNYIGNSYDALNDYKNAVDYHTRHIEGGGNTDYVAFYNRALAYYKNTEYKSALKDLLTAYSMDSTDDDVLIYIAMTEDKLGNAGQAEAFFNKAIQEDPSNAYYHDLRGKFYQQKQNYNAAINDFIVSVNLYPNDCEIYYSLGKLYLDIQDSEKAKASFRESLRLGCEKAGEYLK